jgi:hypothetical protein
MTGKSWPEVAGCLTQINPATGFEEAKRLPRTWRTAIALRFLSAVCGGLLWVASVSWAISPGPDARGSERTLKARIDQAQLVIAGRVHAVRPPTRRIGSEHDPLWSEADIEVDEVSRALRAGRSRSCFRPAEMSCGTRYPSRRSVRAASGFSAQDCRQHLRGKSASLIQRTFRLLLNCLG